MSRPVGIPEAIDGVSGVVAVLVDLMIYTTIAAIDIAVDIWCDGRMVESRIKISEYITVLTVDFDFAQLIRPFCLCLSQYSLRLIYIGCALEIDQRSSYIYTAECRLCGD